MVAHSALRDDDAGAQGGSWVYVARAIATLVMLHAYAMRALQLYGTRDAALLWDMLGEPWGG